MTMYCGLEVALKSSQAGEKRRHISSHTWLKTKVDYQKLRPSWVWHDENHPKSAGLSITLVAQSHMTCSRNNRLPSWNQSSHRAPGQPHRHEFTGASGQSHVHCDPGQAQVPESLTKFWWWRSIAWGPLRPRTQAGALRWILLFTFCYTSHSFHTLQLSSFFF